MSNEPAPPLFELAYRGERWRFTVSSYGGGEPRLNCRAFYQAECGEWRPCSSRSGKGFTMPLERAGELGETLTQLSRSKCAGGALAGT